MSMIPGSSAGPAMIGWVAGPVRTWRMAALVLAERNMTFAWFNAQGALK